MTDAPERIWVEKSIAEEGNHGSTAWPEREDGSEIEYVRADLSPAVKPLEWENTVGDSWRSTAIGLRYYAFKTEDGSWTAYTEGYQFWSKLECRTLEEAQEAAQDDYERRILSALTIRLAVEEAAKVEKLEKALRLCARGDLTTIEKGNIAMKALLEPAGEQGQ